MYDARQISGILLLATITFVSAQDLQPELSVEQTPVKTQEQPEQKQPELSVGETRIRAGIVLLGALHDTMARVQDKESAEAAVTVIMRLTRELPAWGQGFAALPPLDEETQSTLEKRYLPIINQLNERIQIQADRIAAAEFYGSENLPAALIKLVNSVQ